MSDESDEVYGGDGRFNIRGLLPYRLPDDYSASTFNQGPPARDLPPFFTPNAFLSDLTSSPRTRARIRPQAQYIFPPTRPTVERTLRVQTKDIHDGKKFTVVYPYKRICPTCNGNESGMLSQETCDACNSYGTLRVRDESGWRQCVTCNQCNGSSGKLINVPCNQCHGEIVTTERSVTFVIPKGHPMDQPILFEKEAGVLGDLVVNFQVIA